MTAASSRTFPGHEYSTSKLISWVVGASSRKAEPTGGPHRKVSSQRGHIGQTFPQRGKMNRKDSQPIPEILAKLTVADHSFQVAVGRGDDPHVHMP